MNTRPAPARRSLRIVLSIAAKDILDALKNKTTLAALITTLMLAMIYQFLPSLSTDEIPFVFLHDQGSSVHTSALEASPSMTVRVYDSFALFEERFRIHADGELGLVLPADFDQTLASGGTPRIQGYVMHWVDPQRVDQQRLDLEQRISAVVGAPVVIDMQGGTLTLLPESRGGFLAAAGAVIVIMMLGMVLIPNLMLEEKSARTLDALLVSPASSGQIVAAKALAGMFYSLIFIVVIFAMNASFILQWGLAMLTLLLATLFAVAIGLLLGTLIDNRQQLLVAANVVIAPLLLPIFVTAMGDLLPAWLVAVLRWIPTVITTDLLLTSFSALPAYAQTLPRLGVLLASVMLLLGWEAWLVRRSDR